MAASRSLLPETPSSSTPPGSAGSHIHVGASPHPPARGAAAGSAAPKPRCLARRAARPRRTALARSVGTAGGRRARMPFPSQPAGGWRVLPRSGRPLGTGGRPKTDRQGRLRGWGGVQVSPVGPGQAPESAQHRGELPRPTLDGDREDRDDEGHGMARTSDGRASRAEPGQVPRPPRHLGQARAPPPPSARPPGGLG